MQTARCTIDNTEYTASQLSQFPSANREALRGYLICPYCGEPAFYRNSSPAGNGHRRRSPCFYSRPHGSNCDITRTHSDPWESEDGDETVSEWIRRNRKLIVQIQTDGEAPTASDNQGTDTDDGERSQSGGSRTRQSPNVRRGPQRILEQLIEWPSFKTSPLLIRLPDPSQTEVPVHTAFVRFEDAALERHTDHWHGFWGIVPPLTYWSRGASYYANFGNSDSAFRISIPESHIPAILQRYRLSQIRDIVGGYLLLFDLARVTNTGKFTSDVISVNHIGFFRPAL